jgi:hypothetical protein
MVAIVHPTIRDECSTTLCLAKEVPTARVVPALSTKTKAWWLIWFAKCTWWEMNPMQGPSITHSLASLVVFLPLKFA